MPSAAEFSCKRVQFSCKRVQSRTCSGYAKRSRKCQEIELAHIAERSRKSQRKCQEKVRVYEPMSGQDKPVISDGFEMQTIHSQPVGLQAVMRICAGLTGFSGK